MELGEEGLVFHPSLEVGADRGFLRLIEGLINDIYNAAKLIPRLAKGRVSYKVSRGPCDTGGGSLVAASSQLSGARSLTFYVLMVPSV